jgi:hypothetical protein
MMNNRIRGVKASRDQNDLELVLLSLRERRHR